MRRLWCGDRGETAAASQGRNRHTPVSNPTPVSTSATTMLDERNHRSTQRRSIGGRAAGMETLLADTPTRCTSSRSRTPTGTRALGGRKTKRAAEAVERATATASQCESNYAKAAEQGEDENGLAVNSRSGQAQAHGGGAGSASGGCLPRRAHGTEPPDSTPPESRLWQSCGKASAELTGRRRRHARSEHGPAGAVRPSGAVARMTAPSWCHQ